MAAPSEALARAGNDVQQLAGGLNDIYAQIAKKERDTDRLLKSIDAKFGIENDFGELAAAFKGTNDPKEIDFIYDNGVPDGKGGFLVPGVKGLVQKYRDMAEGDPELEAQIIGYIGSHAADLNGARIAKKFDVRKEHAKTQWDAILPDFLEKYAQTADPTQREILKNDLAINREMLVGTGLLDESDSAKALADTLNSAEVFRAKVAVQDNPYSALNQINADEFEVTEKEKIDLIDKATKEIKSIETEARQEQDRAEARAERYHDKMVEQNDLQLLNAFYSGTLKKSDLDNLAKNNAVGKTTYSVLSEKIANGDAVTKNDPVVVSKISEAIERKNYTSANEQLESAFRAKQIRGDSYIQLKTNMTKDMVADGLSYINKAIQPGEFDLSADNKQKHADAVELYHTMVASGKDPMDASKEVLRVSKKEDLKLLNYRRPRYLNGSIVNIDTIQQSKENTISAFNRGELSGAEYNLEMEHIDTMERAALRVQKIQESSADLEQDAKDLKIRK